MAISTSCFVAALEPFTPQVGDLLNPAVLEAKKADWKNPTRLLAKASASNFGLRSAEFSIFDLWWELSIPARELHDAEHTSDGSGAIDSEVKEAFARLAAIVNDAKTEYSQVGYRHVNRVSGSDRFVIFSDHHMAFAGSRQDFFRTSGNDALYAEILTEYADTGFTLVENGDVEELLIHEPMLPTPFGQLALQDQVRDTMDINDPGWDALDASRTQWRLVQLSQVIANYRALYEQINTQFVDQDRYIRIAGNHDQDLQDPRFLGLLRSVYPKLEQVYDVLIIEPEDATDPAFVVCHGHHFDTATTPKYARRIGEPLSECLAWAYEGADRVWRWDGVDGVQRWANGGEAFNNTLVTDDAEPYSFSLGDVVETDLSTWLGLLIPSPDAVLAFILDALGGIDGMAASLADEMSKPGFWESIFKHNISWEYFRNDDAGEAILSEVFCGQRWFKFRHLDEVFINDQLTSVFGANVPYLVLGHSHEPRHKSSIPETSQQADRYLNSGAAGRFENLIWCLEIIDGVPQVVAWHRPGGPNSDEVPERRTYLPSVVGKVGQLVASDEHVPLPPVEEEKTRWFEPVLHMMMSQP